MRFTQRKRHGASVIVAELVMIVIVLIVAVVMGGFTFGLFSSFAAPALVWAESGMCSASGNTVTCQLTLLNEGSHNTATTGTCSINEGSVVIGSIVGGGTVPADGTLGGVKCVATGSPIAPGTQLSGTLPLTNGAVLFFVGTLE